MLETEAEIYLLCSDESHSKAALSQRGKMGVISSGKVFYGLWKNRIVRSVLLNTAAGQMVKCSALILACRGQ